ncbi:hypothetical protein AIIKEEIJ_00899 [Rhodococcus sp. YH1]|nr:hypothetical protein [Rhodococcus sp. YH1]
MEPVDGSAAPLFGQPGGLELGELEATGEQVLGEGIPAVGGVTAPEHLGRGLVEAALGQVVPRRLRAGRTQLLGVELLRGRVGGDEPGAGAPVALHRRTAALVVEGVADPVGELLDGLDEADVLDLLQERVHVAALAAAEAVEVTVVGADVEGRGLLVVEGTQPLHRVGAAAPEGDVLADDVLDPDAVADGRDVSV